MDQKRNNPPALSDEQRARALEAAKKTRRARCELKQKIASCELTFGELFKMAEDGDIVAGRMKVRDAVSALPGVGRATTASILEKANVLTDRRINGLGRVQKEALVEAADAAQAAANAEA